MKKSTVTLFVATVATASTTPLALASRAFAQHGPMPHAAMQHGDMKMGMSGMKMGMSGMMSLKQLSGRAFDIAFLSQMIPHHESATAMSKDALPTLKNAHVRKHAQKIIADQKKEIAEMQSLLQNDYKTKPSSDQMSLMKADMQPMMAMKMSGVRAFLQMMIPHHESANAMSRLALAKSKSPKILSLAQRIVTAQSAEIKDFQALLKSDHLAL